MCVNKMHTYLPISHINVQIKTIFTTNATLSKQSQCINVIQRLLYERMGRMRHMGHLKSNFCYLNKY